MKRSTIALVGLVVVVPLLGPSEAAALNGDRLLFRVATSATADSNLFRLPPDADTQSILGTSQRSDISITNTVGMALNLPYSRQRFIADIALSKTRFSRFTNLNYEGRDLRGSWEWALGNDLSGSLTKTEQTTLAGFSNFQGDVRNVLTQSATSFSANYMLTPEIRLESSVARTTLKNSAAARTVNDYTDKTVQFNAKYISALGNSYGIGLRKTEAVFTNPQIFAGSLFGSDYSEHEIDALYDWRLSALTRFYGRVGTISRQYPQLSGRSFSGLVGSASADWIPSAKTSFTVSARRDITAYQDLATNYVLMNALSIKPTWLATPKTTVRGSYDYEHSEYLGDPGFVLGVSTRRADRIHRLGATLSYQALSNLQFSLAGTYEKRTSNFALYDYATRIVTASVQIQF